MKKTIHCVSITVSDRSETNPILTGEKRKEEKRGEEKRREIGECTDTNAIRQDKTRQDKDKDTSQFEQHCLKNSTK
jgi:hypothetical protein